MPLLGQHCVDLAGYGLDQRFEGRRGHPVGGLHELDEGELARAVDADIKMKSAFGGPDLGDVDMEVADGLWLELALGRFVALDVGRPADAVALQTAMQRRAREVRDRRL